MTEYNPGEILARRPPRRRLPEPVIYVAPTGRWPARWEAVATIDADHDTDSSQFPYYYDGTGTGYTRRMASDAALADLRRILDAQDRDDHRGRYAWRLDR